MQTCLKSISLMKVMQRMAYITLGKDENNCFQSDVRFDFVLGIIVDVLV